MFNLFNNRICFLQYVVRECVNCQETIFVIYPVSNDTHSKGDLQFNRRHLLHQQHTLLQTPTPGRRKAGR